MRVRVGFGAVGFDVGRRVRVAEARFDFVGQVRFDARSKACRVGFEAARHFGVIEHALHPNRGFADGQVAARTAGNFGRTAQAAGNGVHDGIGGVFGGFESGSRRVRRNNFAQSLLLQSGVSAVQQGGQSVGERVVVRHFKDFRGVFFHRGNENPRRAQVVNGGLRPARYPHNPQSAVRVFPRIGKTERVFVGAVVRKVSVGRKRIFAVVAGNGVAVFGVRQPVFLRLFAFDVFQVQRQGDVFRIRGDNRRSYRRFGQNDIQSPARDFVRLQNAADRQHPLQRNGFSFNALRGQNRRPVKGGWRIKLDFSCRGYRVVRKVVFGFSVAAKSQIVVQRGNVNPVEIRGFIGGKLFGGSYLHGSIIDFQGSVS